MLSTPFTRIREGAAEGSMGLIQLNCNSGQVPQVAEHPREQNCPHPWQGTLCMALFLQDVSFSPSISNSYVEDSHGHSQSLLDLGSKTPQPLQGSHWCKWRCHPLCVGNSHLWLYLHAFLNYKGQNAWSLSSLRIVIILQNLSQLFCDKCVFPNPPPPSIITHMNHLWTRT